MLTTSGADGAAGSAGAMLDGTTALDFKDGGGGGGGGGAGYIIVRTAMYQPDIPVISPPATPQAP
jgi:hypothetical protein